VLFYFNCIKHVEEVCHTDFHWDKLTAGRWTVHSTCKSHSFIHPFSNYVCTGKITRNNDLSIEHFPSDIYLACTIRWYHVYSSWYFIAQMLWWHKTHLTIASVPVLNMSKILCNQILFHINITLMQPISCKEFLFKIKNK